MDKEFQDASESSVAFYHDVGYGLPPKLDVHRANGVELPVSEVLVSVQRRTAAFEQCHETRPSMHNLGTPTIPDAHSKNRRLCYQHSKTGILCKTVALSLNNLKPCRSDTRIISGNSKPTLLNYRGKSSARSGFWIRLLSVFRFGSKVGSRD
ncbi:hypothetical protein BDP27DRAFT_1485585 [Rhodocollybia butyracea]|uniref:Uncharacterized protein n=1 Tax=Rhodocollybia butyracea TaxID=206335 RepID=A0A9P5TZP4_9AGAR|nr:hypothetical protein BDP27DRAFT_1485585 [Rhodocollybia butyracea]